MERPRRPRDPLEAAEAAFRKIPAKHAQDSPKPAAIPGVRQQVSLRLDEAVLEHFQAEGPGWQDRINDALKTFVKR